MSGYMLSLTIVLELLTIGAFISAKTVFCVRAKWKVPHIHK